MRLIQGGRTVNLIKKTVIPLGRPLYIPKEDNLGLDQLEIESTGNYRVIDKENFIVIKNDECCRSIQVTVTRRDVC